MAQTLKLEYIRIHEALHSPAKNHITINCQMYPIKKATNGCRSVSYDGILWMEQNKNKSSEYAKRAQKGEKITWGIRGVDMGSWILIDEATYQQYKGSMTTSPV